MKMETRLTGWDNIQRVALAPSAFSAVEITEKVDGSQLVFLKDVNGVLHIRSKGKVFDLSSEGSVDKMFNKAVEYLKSIEADIVMNYIHYCEYLSALRHVSLRYDRLPQNNLILWAVRHIETNVYLRHSDLELIAINLGIDSIPKCNNLESISYYSDTETVEGLIYTAYNEDSTQCYKYKQVSDRFQEVKKALKDKKHTGLTKKDSWQEFKDCFKSEARWIKSAQRLKEQGVLKFDMSDIGLLFKDINADILKEEQEMINEFFRKHFLKELLKTATTGTAEWYRSWLNQNKEEN